MGHLWLGLALGDEVQRDEPRDDAVERAGARLQSTYRLGGDALGDRVAVQVPARERHQQVVLEKAHGQIPWRIMYGGRDASLTMTRSLLE